LPYFWRMEDKTVTFTLKLEKETHTRIKLFAVKRGITLKDLFMNCVEKLIAEEEAKKK